MKTKSGVSLPKKRRSYYLALFKPVGKSDVEFPIIIENGTYRLTTQSIYATQINWFAAMFHYLRFRLYTDRSKLKLFKYRRTFGRLEIKTINPKNKKS